MKFLPLLAIVLGGLVGTVSSAAETPSWSPEQIDFFERKIRPVLAEQCFKCHSSTGEKIKGGLVLDSRADVLKGGDSGAAVTVGNPDKSLLIEAIRYTDEDLQMPPKHRLTSEQVKDFEEWVRSGLPDPRITSAAEVAKGPDFEAAKKFWSFKPIKDLAPPTPRDTTWSRNPIDRFVLTKLEEKGLRPNPDVDRRLLLRRATFDLTGLPPTPEEMRAFLADTSPEAFARAVDRLLASPAYGEQWGRHWLDVVRYADTSGCNSDFPIPSAFRYRNYVVDAFNRDKPYNEMIREQIAGDLLPAATDEEHFEKVIATGYLAIARRFGSRANEFHLTIEDAIDNLGKSVLGLSVSCARCHDHKFDPIPAKDYYALYGIFESTKFAFPGTEIYRHTKDFVPLAPKAEAEAFLAEAAEAAAIDDKLENLKNEKKKLIRQEKRALEVAKERGVDFYGPPSPFVRTLADVEEELEAAISRQRVLESKADRLPKAYAVSEGKARDAKLQRKGEPTNLGDITPRGFLTVLGGQTLPPEANGSGRRELADWLTDPANPLTARVIVNRIWQHHFGKGIVQTPNDFGLRGKAPTHPELVDWLAMRFVENGWSIKSMHRLMMLSRAYQMSAEETAANSAIDANNDYLWRFNRRRLNAEEIRDSILAVAGSLDRTPAHEHPFPPEAEWHYTQHKPFIANYENSKRSIYLLQQRIRKQPFLDVFDGADTNSTTAVRPLSITPIQALFMMNDSLAHEQADKLAVRVGMACKDDGQRINLAYELALNRPAEATEIQEAQDYIATVRAALAETTLPPEQQPRAALASFARMLMSSNEFIFVE